MILFVGLGNPEAKYALTRHNVGFVALDCLIKYAKIEPKWQNKFNALFTKISTANSDIILVKPQTYMNASGNAVLQFKEYFKVSMDDVYVFHDDLDIKIGEIRIKKGGGNAGHNGLKSIDNLMGNNYNRIRIGISRPQFASDVSEYVLSNFPQNELDLVVKKIDVLFANVGLLLGGDFNKLQGLLTLN